MHALAHAEGTRRPRQVYTAHTHRHRSGTACARPATGLCASSPQVAAATLRDPNSRQLRPVRDINSRGSIRLCKLQQTLVFYRYVGVHMLLQLEYDLGHVIFDSEESSCCTIEVPPALERPRSNWFHTHCRCPCRLSAQRFCFSLLSVCVFPVLTICRLGFVCQCNGAMTDLPRTAAYCLLKVNWLTWP